MKKFIITFAMFLIAAPAFALIPIPNQLNVSDNFCIMNWWSCKPVEKPAPIIEVIVEESPFEGGITQLIAYLQEQILILELKLQILQLQQDIETLTSLGVR